MDQFRTWWIRVALAVSLLVPVYFLFASFGTKYGLFDWTVGFVTMTYLWGARVLFAAAVLGLFALIMAVSIAPRRSVIAASIALLIPLIGIGFGINVRSAAERIPAIHDISTDLDNPPAFSQHVVRARAAVEGANDLDLLNKRTEQGRAFTDLQRQHYADIQPVITSIEPSRTFDIALDLASDEGWTVNGSNADMGDIEATDESFWFGFTDDIAIRVRPEGTGSRVDVRSVSRVGLSDLGANARRLRPYLAELRARLETASQP